MKKTKRIGNSKDLLRACLRVLRSDKKLLVFPLVELFLVLAVICCLSLPWVFPPLVHLRGEYDRWLAHRVGGQRVLATVLPALTGFLVAYTCTFIVAFCNTAMAKAVLSAMNGQPIPMTAALRFAFTRLGAIAGYAFLATTVGMLIRLAERQRWIGWALSLVISISWDLASILAIPILVQEKRGGLAAVRRSAQLFRSIWGDVLISQLKLGLWLMLALVPGMVLLGSALVTNSASLGVLGVGLFVASGGAVLLLTATLDSILSSALYVYAAEGMVPTGFDDPSLDCIWTVREGGGGSIAG